MSNEIALNGKPASARWPRGRAQAIYLSHHDRAIIVRLLNRGVRPADIAYAWRVDREVVLAVREVQVAFRR